MLLTGDTSVQSTSFARLLLEAGLVTPDQLGIARSIKTQRGVHIDDTLLDLRLIDGEKMLVVMSGAWKLPIIDLASGWIDDDLVCLLPAQLYLEENWMPVRDQANGSVLIATAREPAVERAARIASVVSSPVEFAVASSKAIRLAVFRAFDKPPVPLALRLYRAMGRPRD